jgi:hypothetical protein
MKIFASSVISGFEPYRAAAVDAIKALGYEVIRAEDFSASTRSPQIACMTGVRQADLVLLILGERYGAIQASGKSATHEEYQEAKSKKPILVFVQDNVAMDPRQMAFRHEVEQWEGGHQRKSFATPDELRSQVTAAIHKHLLELARGPLDEAEMLKRAEALIRGGSTWNATLVIAISYGPKQEVLRPKELGDRALSKRLHQEARFGEHALLDEHAEVDVRTEGGNLVIEQRERSFRLDELGSITIEQTARYGEEHGLGWLVEEELAGRAERALRFADRVLGMVDATERLTHGCVIGALLDASYMGWKTLEEYRRTPNGGTMGVGSDRVVVPLRSPIRTREQLRFEVKNIAEDLVQLLRREHSRRG